MTDNPQTKQLLAFRVLTLAALICIGLAYFSPIWWVSLKAPQYPAAAFPDGIRIHFHVDSVTNGCQKIESKEKREGEALNCKHEMDAINHFVGMYPIAAGGPVERTYAPFLFSLLGLMMLSFMVVDKKRRIMLMVAGGIAISAWMSYGIYGKGGINALSPNYISDMAGTMDLDPEEYAEWSGYQTINESYNEALGRYFRDMKQIARRVDIMLTATHVVYGLVVIGLIALVIALWKLPIAYWLLGLVPAALPVFFIIEYAAWLWWFGHSLHQMAAFTVKPFMPTVLGQGKVAQFSTFSYPHYGFGLFAAASACLLLAMLIRRKQMRDAA